MCFYCSVLVNSICASLYFFFKQKTAYDMRISDWSSDVCSSDLLATSPLFGLRLVIMAPRLSWKFCFMSVSSTRSCGRLGPASDGFTSPMRSEEHTSELQSLMRISYAVFSLKNKKHTDTEIDGRDIEQNIGQYSE